MDLSESKTVSIEIFDESSKEPSFFFFTMSSCVSAWEQSCFAVSAPSPVDLLLAALGTCTSYYVLHFCQQRDIPLDDVFLSVDVERDQESKRIAKILLSINLPASFPEQYLDAIVKAASQCTVKEYLQDCPAIETAAPKAEVAART